jgi:hypothetical protein
MCGIFGFVAKAGATVHRPQVDLLVRLLFRLSETRGREAAGIAMLGGDTMAVHRTASAASDFLKSATFAELVGAALDRAFGDAERPSRRLAMIGHSRLVTNGLQGIGANNQPLVRGEMALVHNGIVVNVDEVWAAHPELTRQAEVDTEIIAALMEARVASGSAAETAVRQVFAEIRGETNIVALRPGEGLLALATNTGSLYRVENASLGITAFVSEHYIAQQVVAQSGLDGTAGAWRISQLRAGRGALIDLSSLEQSEFALAPVSAATAPVVVTAPTRAAIKVLDTDREAEARRRSMKRCSRCVLPETMPFIEFDAAGVCNYCRHHQPITYKGLEALEEVLAPQRKANGEPDCIVAFSGGRDSCYALHLLVKELGMRPLAFTYDWGMVTDLARRNQARMCADLGIEHIWISADIKAKRANIRRNVNAWLATPQLGLIPLFIAGDKHFFWHANRLQKQTGLKLMVLAENRLERTDFKSGFCGVPPRFERGDGSYQLGGLRLTRMAGFYGMAFARNPRFINASLWDTVTASGSYYLIPHDYLWLFHYLPWDEAVVDSILLGTYDWERAKDTDRTWRIGDGTAAFYNFIYHTVAGFSEFDTFRSNQIREGVMSREEALGLLEADNQPRFASIIEYCQTIGVDFDRLMLVVSSIPKLY